MTAKKPWIPHGFQRQQIGLLLPRCFISSVQVLNFLQKMARYGDVEGFVDRYLFVDFLVDRTGPKKRVNKHCRTCRTLVLVKIHKKIHSARCY